MAQTKTAFPCGRISPQRGNSIVLDVWTSGDLVKNLFRKDGITVKRLIELAFVCGFLFVLVGCSDTKPATKTGGAAGVTKTETKTTAK